MVDDDLSPCQPLPAPDVRARLAEALQRSPFRAGLYIPIDAAANVLLSLPGIAIVELPEPDREVPPHLFNSMAWGSETNIELAAWPQDGVITNVEGEEISPRECREYAAALLAAANAAEEKHD